MVDQVDIQDPGGAGELQGQRHIGRGWCGIAAGVVGDSLRRRLADRNANLSRLLQEEGRHIQQIRLGEESRAMGAMDDLLRKGLYVQAIRPPTVPDGTSRLRIALSAAHTEDQVDRLAEAMRGLGLFHVER